MRIVVILLLVSCGLFASANVNGTYANEGKKKIEMSFTNGDLKAWKYSAEIDRTLYKKELKALVTIDNDDDFRDKMRLLRSYYPNQEQYDPFAKSTLDKMTRYAYTADMSEDAAEANDAIFKYRDLLMANIPNLEVVEYALMLSRVDVKYGNEIFLKRARDALREICYNLYGLNGESPQHAYNIVTYGEETYILQIRNVTVKKSEVYEVNKSFYDVQDVETEDGEYKQLYFDVTSPIRSINIRRALAEKERKIIIPLQ